MKKLLALATLTAAFATSQAQSIDWTKTTTPPPLSAFDFSYTSDGESYLLSGWPLYEVTYAMPFKMDFKAGHGLVWGTKLSDVVSDSTPIYGYGVYASKGIGGDGVYLKGSAMVLFDNAARKKATFAVGIGLGFEF